jgi:hypothetical protein
VARRKKIRPSRWLAGLCLFAIGAGLYRDDWRPILAGIGGLSLMLSAWLAFRVTVPCDVKNHTKPGFCTHPTRGLLFGCQDHGWEKVAAWSRYLGTGYLARRLHLHDFPILRFQATRQPAPEMAAVAPDGLTIAAPVSVAPKRVTPDESKQVALFYIAVISCVATVAGTAATIVEIVMSASR